jgi:hypothetical protein
MAKCAKGLGQSSTARSLKVSFFIFLLSLFFCKPIMAELVVYGEATIPLDTDAFVYVFVDIEEMRQIFDIIPYNQLKSREAEMVINSTELAIAALFTSDTGRFFQIVGFGSYPNFAMNVILAINRNWRYVFSDSKSYWYSNTDRLSLRLNPEEVYAAGWRRTQVNPVSEEPGARMPEGFIAFRHRSGQTAPLSLWLENHDSIFNRILNDEGFTTNLPIERIYLNLYHIENNAFKADIMLHIRSSFYWSDFYMASSSTKPDSTMRSLFLANPLVQNDHSLEFESALLSGEALASLMTIFIRNWR